MLNTRSNFTGAVFDDIKFEQDKLPSEDDQVQYYVSNRAWHLPLCGSDKAPWWPLWDALPLFDKDCIQSEAVAVVNLSTRPRPVQLVMDQVRRNSSLVVMQPQPNGLDSLSWHSKFCCCCKHIFTSPTAQTHWFWRARHPSRSFFKNMFYLHKNE